MTRPARLSLTSQLPAPDQPILVVQHFTGPSKREASQDACRGVLDRQSVGLDMHHLRLGPGDLKKRAGHSMAPPAIFQ